MPKKRIIWHLYPTYLILTIITLVAVSWYGTSGLKELALEQTTADLKSRVALVEPELIKPIINGEAARVDSLCKSMGIASSTRITVILKDGKVIGDSENDPVRMENHKNRPEVLAVFSSQEGLNTRYSNTLHLNMVYLAMPVIAENEIMAVIRVSVPLMSLEKIVGPIRTKIILFGIVVMVLMAAASLYIARRIARPIEILQQGAERYARGELNHKLSISEDDELGELAAAMNKMASTLNERIETITRQRNEREAILASMVEGVIAVDDDERILSLNLAAARLAAVEPSLVAGKTIQEAIRIPSMQKFISKSLESSGPTEGEIVITSGGEKNIKMQGMPLMDSQGRCIGALIVLNDVTRIKKLENLRRDFVANVSHELKTPITSIKGFMETLLDGALKSPEDTEKFLKIIQRQVDRLNNIIQDILTLSYIDKETEEERIPLEISPINEVLKNSIDSINSKASLRNIKINLDCDEHLAGNINPALLEQAVVNLIDNAVNYSEAGTVIEITAAAEDGRVKISVRDHGSGIEREHLPRIFERFYRVDKARSRAVGGTGLGLAIVKHIILAHGGTINVESTPGAGSIFTIILPRQ